MKIAITLDFSPQLKLFLKDIFMTDIADNVAATLAAVTALTPQVTALTAAVAAITPQPPVDLTGINTKLDTIIADLNTTPPTP